MSLFHFAVPLTATEADTARARDRVILRFDTVGVLVDCGEHISTTPRGPSYRLLAIRRPRKPEPPKTYDFLNLL